MRREKAAPSRVGAAALVMGLFATLAACGETTPKYSSSTVCGVDSKIIVDIMGTDRFTVGKSVTRSTSDSPPAPRSGDLPLSKENGGITRMECEIRTAEDAPTTSFTFSLTDRTDADTLIEDINGSNQPFETGGGVATTSFLSDNHASWRWACLTPSNDGSPIAGGSVGPEDVTESLRKELVEAVAAAAGCPAPS